MNKKILIGIVVVAVCFLIGMIQMFGERSQAPSVSRIGIPSKDPVTSEIKAIAEATAPKAVKAEAPSASGAVELSGADKPSSEALFAALNDSDLTRRLDKVKALLSQGVDLNVKNEKGLTPLVLVIEDKRGDLALVDTLLQGGADAVSKDADGLTPLHWAAVSSMAYWPPEKHPQLLSLLLKHGAQVNQKTDSGHPVLLMAAAKAGAESLKVLLEAGADVNAATEEGLTALMQAAWTNPDPAALPLLLANGADPMARDRKEASALDYLKRRNLPEEMRQRLQSVLIEAEKNYKPKAAPKASAPKASAPKPAENRDAFLKANAFESAEEVEKLVKQGLDVNGWGEQLQTTPLLSAIVDKDRGRALKKVKFLLKAGADPNGVDDQGLTPLHLTAMKSGSVEIMEALVAAGAKIDIKNPGGNTPLMIAAWGGEDLSPKEQLESLKILINAKADLNKSNPKGSTALALAAVKARPEIIKLLIENGAQVDAQLLDGRTPLMIAARNGGLKAVEMLLARGADPAIRDQEGLTALDQASLSDGPEAEKIKALLIKIQNQ